MVMMIFTETDNRGERALFETSQRSLPPELDAKAKSILVTKIPVWVFDRPNFSGTRVLFNNRGGCNDLAACVPRGGSWRNRIRSISFGEGIGVLAEEEDPDSIGYAESQIPDGILGEGHSPLNAALNSYISVSLQYRGSGQANFEFEDLACNSRPPRNFVITLHADRPVATQICSSGAHRDGYGHLRYRKVGGHNWSSTSLLVNRSTVPVW
jgi:hypothetical protein